MWREIFSDPDISPFLSCELRTRFLHLFTATIMSAHQYRLTILALSVTIRVVIAVLSIVLIVLLVAMKPRCVVIEMCDRLSDVNVFIARYLSGS